MFCPGNFLVDIFADNFFPKLSVSNFKRGLNIFYF
jgi:hypothetical protein